MLKTMFECEYSLPRLAIANKRFRSCYKLARHWRQITKHKCKTCSEKVSSKNVALKIDCYKFFTFLRRFYSFSASYHCHLCSYQLFCRNQLANNCTHIFRLATVPSCVAARAFPTWATFTTTPSTRFTKNVQTHRPLMEDTEVTNRTWTRTRKVIGLHLARLQHVSRLQPLSKTIITVLYANALPLTF